DVGPPRRARVGRRACLEHPPRAPRATLEALLEGPPPAPQLHDLPLEVRGIHLRADFVKDLHLRLHAPRPLGLILGRATPLQPAVPPRFPAITGPSTVFGSGVISTCRPPPASQLRGLSVGGC